MISPDARVKEASFYPPHMLDSFGNPSPSALVPYCAFKGNMNMTGEYIDGLNFPVCNKFKPVIQEGQNCYALNINSVILKSDQKTRRGIANGILIAIDTDQPTTFEMANKIENREQMRGQLRGGRPAISNRMTMLSISSLERYTDYCQGGSCSYKMTNLKKMTGTESFLALSDEIKDCQLEAEEECRQRKLLQETQQRCGCLPWVLENVKPKHVSFKKVCTRY